MLLGCAARVCCLLKTDPATCLWVFALNGLRGLALICEIQVTAVTVQNELGLELAANPGAALPHQCIAECCSRR